MVRSAVVGFVVVLLVAKAVTGLNAIPFHWEERTKTIHLQPAVTKACEIVGSNGKLEFAGRDDSSKTADLVVRCTAWATTSERAQQAVDAIEVTAESKDSENCRIGWHWRTPQESDWSAVVDFDLRASKSANLKFESQNGPVIIKNLGGNAKIHARNGSIDAETTGDSLNATVDNGSITAKFSGKAVNLRSRNGRIAADLSESRSIEGEIATNNGGVEVTLGKQTACELVTKTKHGRRNFRGGKIGSGGGKLVASTHNGAILIHGASDDEP